MINHILKTKKKVEKWSIKPSNKCNFCQSVDTIEHHLYQWENSKIIWDKLGNWFLINIQLKLNLKECKILHPHSPAAHLVLINFYILMTKCYIYKQRSDNKELYFIELLRTIKYKIKIYIKAIMWMAKWINPGKTC